MAYIGKNKIPRRQIGPAADNLGIEEEYPIEELVIKPASFDKEPPHSFPTPTAPQPNQNQIRGRKRGRPIGSGNSAEKASAKSKENDNKTTSNSIWLSITEAAKIGGVQTKTVRRALKSNLIKYKIISDRYSVELDSLLIFLQGSTKLRNKLDQLGIGQYVEKWKKHISLDKNK